jgi:23S rRNA pseudouridine1911/1915/1917 synthase
MNKKEKIILKADASGQRLDKYLAQNLRDYSRAAIQKLIKAGEAKVNSQAQKPHYLVRVNDLIEVSLSQEEEFISQKEIEKWPLEIVAETKDYLVVNKPAGLITHGEEYIKKITLADVLLAKYPELSSLQPQPRRAGIVHRLDKEVSGLLVVARTSRQLEDLQQQFRKRIVKKKYLALVYGAIEHNSGLIDFPLARSADGRKTAARPRGSEGREAITYYQVKKRFINYTYLEVSPKTGRMHQIRAHLSAIAHPLVGDDLYGTKKTRQLNKKLNLGRIFLVAFYLSFFDLAGEKQVFQIDLPVDLKELLKRIK